MFCSGTGTDGTNGIRAIKEHGGLTFAQAPETAKYEGMPESAIASGLIDAVLPVEEMPGRLQVYSRHLTDTKSGGAAKLDAEIAANLPNIAEILLRHTGHDFSRYKEGTLVRRIGRRVRIQDSTSVADYVHRLEREPGEAELLVRDLSIGVTHFFRDAEVFDALAKLCLPALLDSGDSSIPVRIWVPGCASGEEAYSIAILVREHLSRSQTARTVQIFATDIDSELIATARLGRYSDEIRQHVSPERLKCFFTADDATFQVVKELRAICTFSAHSLIKHPPFSSLDLISCRNVFIYLGTDLQKKLVPLFHFALRPGGYLLLGPSEDLATHDQLFIGVDRQHRLFLRNDGVIRPPELPLLGRSASRGTIHSLPPKSESPAQPPMLSQALERMIREEYAPPCVVVNERGEILYMTGRTSRYLQAREGAPTNNILDQAHTNLRLELRAALATVIRTRRTVVRRNVSVEPAVTGANVHHLHLTVRPLPGVTADAGLYAVVLEGSEVATDLEAEGETESASGSEREHFIVEQLEDELRTTRADLQSSAEELETSNEELKSANEELISTNEELQSANEELQSSREELQTVNDELREKMQMLDVAQSDLQSHYASSRIATIFLDCDLRITSITPAAIALFRLIAGDVGRLIRDLALHIRSDELLENAQSVLQTQVGFEGHVGTTDGGIRFLMRILPTYRQGNVLTGVGITFVNVTGLLRAEEAERRYGDLLMLSPDAIFVWRVDDGTIETWNRGAEELYDYSSSEALGQVPRELLHTVLPCPIAEIEIAMREQGRWAGDVVQRTKDGRTVVVSAKLQAMRSDDRVEQILETHQDITERKQIERLYAVLSQANEAIVRVHDEQALYDEVCRIIADEGQFPLVSIGLAKGDEVEPAASSGPAVDYLGAAKITVEGALGTGPTGTCIREDRPVVNNDFETNPTTTPWRELARRRGFRASAAFPLHRRAKSIGALTLYATRPGAFDAEHVRLLNGLSANLSYALDAMQQEALRNEAERALRESEQSLREIDRSKNEFLAMLSHELRNPLTPIVSSLFILEHAEPGGDQSSRAKTVITRQVGHLTRLVDDLLDVTRMTRGKFRLQQARFDLVRNGKPCSRGSQGDMRGCGYHVRYSNWCSTDLDQR